MPSPHFPLDKLSAQCTENSQIVSTGYPSSVAIASDMSWRGQDESISSTSMKIDHASHVTQRGGTSGRTGSSITLGISSWRRPQAEATWGSGSDRVEARRWPKEGEPLLELLMGPPGSDLPVSMPLPAGVRELPLAGLRIGEFFAAGSFGRLYYAEEQNVSLALKILRAPGEDNVILQNELEKQFKQEITLLARLSHPNIVSLKGAFQRPDNRPVWVIATEFCTGGSVFKFLQEKSTEGWPIALRKVYCMALDIAQGMDYLHSMSVIHRDLKTDNLLIDKSDSGRIKIADFGMARIQEHRDMMTPETGTYRYMAPEMIQRSRRYTRKVDVYSFGICLWEIYTCRIPYENLTAIMAAHQVVTRQLRPELPKECPEDLAQLMKDCWQHDPRRRPEFSEIVSRLKLLQASAHERTGRAVMRQIRRLFQ